MQYICWWRFPVLCTWLYLCSANALAGIRSQFVSVLTVLTGTHGSMLPVYQFASPVEGLWESPGLTL